MSGNGLPINILQPTILSEIARTMCAVVAVGATPGTRALLAAGATTLRHSPANSAFVSCFKVTKNVGITNMHVCYSMYSNY